MDVKLTPEDIQNIIQSTLDSVGDAASSNYSLPIKPLKLERVDYLQDKGLAQQAKTTKTLVIGGVAAGMSAASKLKRANRESKVTVYERGERPSYGACGLPYYLSGDNDDYRKMIIRTEEEFSQMGIKVFTRHEVLQIDPNQKQVVVKDLANNRTFTDSYDSLMIATGASPILPSIPGVQLGNIYTLKTIEDGVGIKKVLDNPKTQNIVVVGGGYIGIEVVDAILQLGKNIRLIELSDSILANFDFEITDIALQHLRDKGANLNLGEKVERFVGIDNVEVVQTNKGNYHADLVILAVGVKPETEFLNDSGINLAKNGAIVVDREMKTNIDSVYAAGDCAQVYNAITQGNDFIPLGTNANKCGRLAGENIAGRNSKHIGTLGSAAIKVCELELGRTGLSESQAKNLGVEYTAVFVQSFDRPKYYPAPTQIWVKLICEKVTKRILGAQAIGNKGAVLRINTFAVAIHNKMSADMLGMADLVYAPPFSGVWDVIHIACNAVK